MRGFGGQIGNLATVLLFAACMFAGLIQYYLSRWRGRWFVRRLWNGVATRVRLVRQESLPWRRRREVLKRVEELRALGFEEVGQFSISELAGMYLHGFVKPADSVFATVSEQPRQGVHLAFSTYYADGTRLVSTTQVRGAFLYTPPKTTLVRALERSTRAMYERFLVERPAGVMLKHSAADFVPRYESSHAKAMDAVNARGGPDENDIRQAFIGAKRRVPNLMIPTYRAVLARKAIAGLDVALRERYAADQAGRSERTPLELNEAADNRLVFVHDVMTLDDALGLFARSLTPEQKHILDQPIPARPRQAFALLNSCLPSSRQFRKLGELADPVSADVYEPPVPAAKPKEELFVDV